MKNNNLFLSVTSALGAAVYIALVATVMTNGDRFFGPGPDGKGIAIPIAVLMLLVLSVGVVGSLLFGRGAYLFFQGKRRDGVRAVVTTLGTFFVLTVAYFLVLALVR